MMDRKITTTILLAALATVALLWGYRWTTLWDTQASSIQEDVSPADDLKRDAKQKPERPQGNSTTPANSGRPAPAATPSAPPPDALPEPRVGEAAGAELQRIADKVTVWPTSKEGIDGAVGEVLRDILRCYQRAVNEGIEMEGVLDLQFIIADSDGLGKVQSVDILGGSFEDVPTEDCLMDVLSVLQFDPPEEMEQTVHYPFEFSTE
jgi:hypothetical protein